MISRLGKEVLSAIREQKDGMIQFLGDLARAESPSTIPGSQKAVLNLLRGAFEDLDYQTMIVPGRETGGYLYSRPGNRPRRNPIQLLVGHCDTVWPLGTIQDMPLSLEDGMVKGPGVYDMKGGLTQMYYALKLIKELGLELKVTPVVFINSDEEIGSNESTQAITRLARISDRAFILEPSLGQSGKLKTSRKGVGRFTITVTGKAAHAGLDPGKGVNAIVELSYIIQQLFHMNDPPNNISVNVGMVEGGVRPNVIAPESRAVVDVRVPTHESAEKITDQIFGLKSTNNDAEVFISGGIGRPPMEATPENRRLWDLAKKVGESLGIELEEATAGGASDGNTTSLYTATLDGLGATGDGAHASHEFAFIDKMMERTALLSLLLLEPSLAQIGGNHG